jgi:predicted GNAT superfamily acetyltransferase
MNTTEIKVLGSMEELRKVEDLQALVWGGNDVVPAHMMKAVVDSGGVVIGGFRKNEMIGFVYSFVGLHDYDGETGIKHCSHMLAVHPEFQSSGVGFKLKQAQWKVVRKQGLELITWTFDPLESRNAYLNISKLGAITRTYKKEYYGEMKDQLNTGFPSDRLMVEWWLNSQRTIMRFGQRSKPLSLDKYLSGNTEIINSVKWNSDGFPVPYKDSMDKLDDPENKPKLVMVQIPSNFQAIKSSDNDLAIEWRMYIRVIFELFFNHGYIITDFIYQDGEKSAGYYVFSNGEIKLG